MEASMRYHITRHGVPIGEVDLALGADIAAGDVRPLPAYDAVRTDVQAATRALRSLGAFGPIDEPHGENLERSAVIARGAALGRELDLRDAEGGAVAVDWIELLDFGGSPASVAAWVRARTAPAHVGADLPPRRRGSTDAA
jgi:hypothetical protein